MAVERLDACCRTGIDHFADGVVPKVLLIAGRSASSAPASASTLYSGWPPPTRVVFIARDAARSAGPRLMPCMRGEATAIEATLLTPRRSPNGVNEDRVFHAILRFKLSQQLIEIMDVPSAFDLRQHDDVELLPIAATISVISSSTQGN